MSLDRGVARVLLAPAAGRVGLFFALLLATVFVVSFWVVVNFRLVPAFARQLSYSLRRMRKYAATDRR